MSSTERPLAVVTGASTGIGYELAKECCRNGFDLVVAADEPEIETCEASAPPSMWWRRISPPSKA